MSTLLPAQHSSRRKFLNWIWAGLGVFALLEMAWVVFAFLSRGKTRPSAQFDDAPMVCGTIDQFAPGSVTAFARGRFYLARLEDGGFLAISRQCTHLGCTVPWIEEERKFACPCHASAFDITGAVISAPAPRALDLYPLSIENNVVRVNASEPAPRGGFMKSQVIYPKKT